MPDAFLQSALVVQFEEQTPNTMHQATEEVAARSARPIGALSEAKKRREIDKSGCISRSELQLVRAPGLEPGRPTVEGF